MMIKQVRSVESENGMFEIDLPYTTWEVSVPFGGANLRFFVPEWENRLFWKPCSARLSK